MSLVIVGSVGLDTIETRKGQVTEALGGSAVYGALAASNFTKVHLVGVVGDDFPMEHTQLLEKHDIDLEGLYRYPGKTFRWHGRYEEWNHATTLKTELNVFANFSPEIPLSYRKCRSLLLGNIHPDLQLQVLSSVSNYQFVACDTMNYWIGLCPDKVKEVISKVHIVFINEEEIRQFSGQLDIFAAARQLLCLGPECVVVKRGEYGSVVVTRDSYFFAPAYPIAEVIDPTGAGDTFAGGFMGYLANQKEMTMPYIHSAVRYGTVLAALDVGAFSVENIKHTRMDAVMGMVDELIAWTGGERSGL